MLAKLHSHNENGKWKEIFPLTVEENAPCHLHPLNILRSTFLVLGPKPLLCPYLKLFPFHSNADFLFPAWFLMSKINRYI